MSMATGFDRRHPGGKALYRGVDSGRSAHCYRSVSVSLRRFCVDCRQDRSRWESQIRQTERRPSLHVLGPAPGLSITGPEQSIEGFLKAAEIHLAAGQESLQEVDPALLEVLKDRGLGLGWEPVVVHARRLSPDARTDIRAGPAPGPKAHLQFAIARTRSRCDPRDCYRNPCPTARVSAELPLALVEEIDRRGATSPAVATCRWSSTRR
jgi:hypothetical protein